MLLILKYVTWFLWIYWVDWTLIGKLFWNSVGTSWKLYQSWKKKCCKDGESIFFLFHINWAGWRVFLWYNSLWDHWSSAGWPRWVAADTGTLTFCCYKVKIKFRLKWIDLACFSIFFVFKAPLFTNTFRGQGKLRIKVGCNDFQILRYIYSNCEFPEGP